MSDSILLQGLKRYLTPEQLELLSQTKVGLAGLGGLGSNCALMLVRTGLSKFVLIDDDLVEPSNLNRQQYWPKDVGTFKTEALVARLLDLNPNLDLEICSYKLTAQNLSEVVSKAPLWIEALDQAEMKARVVEAALLSGAFVVGASGVAGFGQNLSRKKVGSNLVLVGDFTSDCQDFPVLAPKVTWASAMMADTVISFILNGGKLPF